MGVRIMALNVREDGTWKAPLWELQSLEVTP